MAIGLSYTYRVAMSMNELVWEGGNVQSRDVHERVGLGGRDKEFMDIATLFIDVETWEIAFPFQGSLENKKGPPRAPPDFTPMCVYCWVVSGAFWEHPSDLCADGGFIPQDQMHLLPDCFICGPEAGARALLEHPAFLS